MSMIPSAVALRYAKALFALGEESGQLEAIVAELGRAASTYEASAELRQALENPLVPHPAKRNIVTEVAQRLSLGASSKNTLLLLSDRRRLRALPAIVRELRVLSDKKRGVVRAVVTAMQLEKMTGKKVELDVSEDASLLAGVVAPHR
jgi:F-type H+-transporting ATPase subunit delta